MKRSLLILCILLCIQSLTIELHTQEDDTDYGNPLIPVCHFGPELGWRFGTGPFILNTSNGKSSQISIAFETGYLFIDDIGKNFDFQFEMLYSLRLDSNATQLHYFCMPFTLNYNFNNLTLFAGPRIEVLFHPSMENKETSTVDLCVDTGCRYRFNEIRYENTFFIDLRVSSNVKSNHNLYRLYDFSVLVGVGYLF